MMFVAAEAGAQQTPRQWNLAASVSASQFSGTAFDTSATGGESLKPERTTEYNVGVSRRLGRLSASLAGGYAITHLTADGPDGLLADRTTALKLYEVGLALNWAVLRTPTGAEVTLGAGPVIDHWSIPDGSHTRLGAQGIAGVSAPLSPRLSALIRGTVSNTGSAFRATDLPSGVVERRSWRYGVGVGLSLGL